MVESIRGVAIYIQHLGLIAYFTVTRHFVHITTIAQLVAIKSDNCSKMLTT